MKQTDKQKKTDKTRYANRQTKRQTDNKTNRQQNRLIVNQTDKQTDRQCYRPVSRWTVNRRKIENKSHSHGNKGRANRKKKGKR